jgi:tRNA modification GTPase
VRFSTDDTIVAIATPAGPGGLGVVRLSGADAHAVARRLLRREDPLAPRHATFARVRHHGAAGDHVVCTFFPGPRSYTGEDVVEISAHGSPVVLSGIVEAAMGCGARLARPGEFTLRAYLHDRMDLVQAEAVADLVDAVTPAQARVAFDQLEGTLTDAIREVEHIVFELTTRLEASVDFPEEAYHFASRDGIRAALASAVTGLDRLLAGAAAGRLIREGAHVVIVGRPNVGKSSLFNALLGAGRAIVTAAPGTTRDLLTERCDIEGSPVTLVDTAGLREVADEVEREGVLRARRAADVATLRLIVLDRSEALTREDQTLLRASIPSRDLIVANKVDKPAAWDAVAAPGASGTEGHAAARFVPVSARTGAGLDHLAREVATRLRGRDAPADTVRMSNVRHIRLVEEARGALIRAAETAARGGSEEFVLADLREASLAFGDVTGRRTAADVLDAIFARFCIGK